MKKRKFKKKPLIFIILLMMITTIGGTFAYYTSETSLANKFKAMTYNVTVEEEFYDDWGTKKVSFVNKEETNSPVVLRIYYDEIWSKEIDDTLLILDNNVNGVNVVNKEWTSSFTNDFIKGDDGWYYYKKVLTSQKSVQVLQSISLNNELIQSSPYKEDYKKYNYQLSFNFESIQADRQAVKEIWNKNINITGSDVSWNI